MPSLLLNALNQQIEYAALSEKEWELLVRQAKSALLGATLWQLIIKQLPANDIPVKVRHHLESDTLLVRRQNELLEYEFFKIKQAIGKVESKIILLKGAAYYAHGLDFAKNRRIADIDLLVPKDKLKTIEQELLFYGWVRTKTDNYDEMYYREWMHEIPPVQHLKRGTVLDVHHNILPVLKRNAPKAELLRNDAIPLNNGLYTLSSVDLFLHCACHLFHEGEFDKGLRDLYDLHCLMTHFFQKDPDFCRLVYERSKTTGLQSSLYLALRYIRLVFNTPIDLQVYQHLESDVPSVTPNPLIDQSFKYVLDVHHSSTTSAWMKLSMFVLYWRGHLLKMPLRILIPHLFRKSFKRLTEKDKPNVKKEL